MCFGGTTSQMVSEMPEIPAPPPIVGEPITTPVPQPDTTAANITPEAEQAAVKPAVAAAKGEKARTGTARLKKTEPTTTGTNVGVNYKGSGSATPSGMSLNIQKQ